MIIFISIFVLTSLISSTLVFSSLNNFPIARPGCKSTCGEVQIPFPFGIKRKCYRTKQFLVTCNNTDFTPPKLFWGNVEITDISLDGQITVVRSIAKNCYDKQQNRSSDNNPILELPSNFRVSNTANKFTIVGCDSYGYVSGRRRIGRNFTTGCTAMCSSRNDLQERECAGAGCCQTTFPEDVWSYSNYTKVSDFSNCSYGFIVKDKAFTFSKDNLTNLSNVTKLPAVLNWDIGKGTCEVAKSNLKAYACKSAESECYEPVSGSGYRCRCRNGYEGNPYLTSGCIDIDECTLKISNCTKNAKCENTIGSYTCSCPKGHKGDGKEGDGCVKKQSLMIAYVLIGIIALLLCIILLYLELKRRSQRKTKHKFFLQNGGSILQEKLATGEVSPQMVTIFTSTELQKATNNFHNSMIIGRGGFGTVYKGVLADRRTVAIKRSIRVDPTQIEQFINEVVILSQINHRNVVILLGCCLETDVPLLVYEFISNGALSSHLHDEAKARVLDWNMRLKIATETADVLSYLHSSASTPIIHRDVKPDNILLDHTFTAKVSDFGASRLVPVDLAQLSTMVQGTFGYLDPEYMQTHQLTEKSDVYSFGVVLLELVTGRKALSFDRPVEEKSLSSYFLYVLKQDLLVKIIDEKIVGSGNMEQIYSVCKLAKECLNVKGEDRPNMKEVAMELQGLILGGKHSWERNNADNIEEMEYLLPNNHDGMGGVSSSVGYDSISRDHIGLPINGGGGR
ncbi:putative wall-associated receptor kinase-like 16 isoform X2 [Salvia splendens]|uniref:putative wall-associated receptor kinase-like 16 isoform X2 n=1 Tax=Salvia splendens TaxID=180675 RepID=UPI001C263AEB|nr:putative wall-associated receptor kinase-like 16 isoform X2 [Salvia splendens]